MPEAKRRVCIVGSGNWGSAVAKLIGENTRQGGRAAHLFEEEVRMWVFEEEVEMPESVTNAKQPKLKRRLSGVINEINENVKYLPGIKLPTNVKAVPDLKEAARGADVLVWVLPHQFVPRTANEIKGVIAPGAVSLSLIKGGLDVTADGALKLCSESIWEILGTDVSVLMGANVANEVARGDFCEATVGCRNLKNGLLFQQLFDGSTFSVSVVEDVAGVELCGALKNIVALAAGFTDGLGMGGNTKAAVVRIGLAEMRLVIQHFYPETKIETFLESCGVADLITTCFGGRNRKCAEAFVRAEGKRSWEDIEKELLGGQKLQGTLTSMELQPVIEKHQLESRVPLLCTVHKICFAGQPASSLFQAFCRHQTLPSRSSL